MITYIDTSILIKLVVDDEPYRSESERLWLDSDLVVCVEIGYVEARAALAAAHRQDRIDAAGLRVAKAELEPLWDQLHLVAVDPVLVRTAGDVAEHDHLRAYDAVHLAAAMRAQVSVMASADRKLAGAARRRGFSGAGPSSGAGAGAPARARRRAGGSCHRAASIAVRPPRE